MRLKTGIWLLAMAILLVALLYLQFGSSGTGSQDVLRASNSRAHQSSQAGVATATCPLQIDPIDPHVKVFEEIGFIDYPFTIKNSGDSAVRILDVVTSCSCTVGRLTAETVGPGETIGLIVRYDVVSKFGELPRKTITLKTDSPGCSDLTNTIGGFRQQRFVVEPATIDWGTVRYGDTERREVTITVSGSDVQLRPDLAKISDPNVRIETASVEASTNGARHVITVIRDATAPVGTSDGTIFIPRNEDDGIGPTIRFRGEIAGPLLVTPNKVFFGFMDQGDQATRTVTVSAFALGSGQIELPAMRIRRFRNVPAGLKLELIAPDSGKVRVTAQAADLGVGNFSHEIIIDCELDGRSCDARLGVLGVVNPKK